MFSLLLAKAGCAAEIPEQAQTSTHTPPVVKAECLSRAAGVKDELRISQKEELVARRDGGE